MRRASAAARWGLPEGVRVDRLGLVEVIEAVTEFLGPQTTSSSSDRPKDDELGG